MNIKFFSHLIDFGHLRGKGGGGGVNKSIKKEKFMTIFFFEMLNEVVKSFEKCYLLMQMLK